MSRLQLRLFEGAAPKFDASFGGLRRVDLDETSWVEHLPRWLSRNELLLDALAKVDGWEQRRRWMFTQEVDEPRLTAEYPVLSQAPDPLLRAIGGALSEHYQVPYDRAWMNLYRDHHDGTGWHADRPRPASSTIPVLSLGETRRFLIRHRDGGPSTAFTAEGGDLIVMRGRCQRDWVHSVPKETKPAGMRISVNFASSQWPAGD
jgi:alkylated DNA repair dioxygenase AlkB